MMITRFSALFVLMGSLLGGLPVVAQAADCQYDVKPVPVFIGTVSRITGDGVLFADGRDVVMPESLLPFVRLANEVKVHGLVSLDGRKIWVLALYDKDRLVCPSVLDVRKGAYPGSAAYDVIEHQGGGSP
ncbi:MULTISPECIES: hypothetical protein [Acetobacteraceae]|uniref:Uncharacterized protein n=1 Tax=Parasaccharibacter apium TaxID=1510841 RepID=A0A7U7G4T2_9PROT|nr:MULTISPECIES: hypothetical protein [Acetobacteraceae]MPV99781.1 hypothetical protein [Bombella apis]MUH03217.1 hypothetical protein [Bombella sp. ESL0387]CDG33122.1 hypothetical protein SACS_0384 [Parasaccharibacter apium]